MECDVESARGCGALTQHLCAREHDLWGSDCQRGMEASEEAMGEWHSWMSLSTRHHGTFGCIPELCPAACTFRPSPSFQRHGARRQVGRPLKNDFSS